jgi:type I restriction enzyme S subunit
MGASGIIDWVNDFIFEGDFVLLGEDGENVLSRQLPLAFRVTGRFWVNNHAHVFAPRSGIDVQFLTLLLEAQDYSTVVSGSAQPKITQAALRGLRFLCPPVGEQRRIAAILDTHDERIRQAQVEATKLRTLKHGLMDDLLTGRVRVTGQAA